MTLKQKMADRLRNKIGEKIRPIVEMKVKEYIAIEEKNIIDSVCSRIEYLALNTDYDLEQVIADLKNGGYKNDKEKCSENN